MDPAIVAAIVGALAALSAEVAKGAANEAGKEAWGKIKILLGPKSSDTLVEAQSEIAEQLEINPETAKTILELLKSSQSNNASQLVGSINAQKVVVANDIDTLNM